MGVEYSHVLGVGDLKWLPGPDTEERVLDVLERWGFVPDRESIERSDDDPEEGGDLVLALGEPAPAKVREVFGPSARGWSGEGHATYLVLGARYKFSSSDVDQPPKPFRCWSCDSELDLEYGDDEILRLRSVPERCPDADCEGRVVCPERQPGPGSSWAVWRSGLVIDCAKDHPAFTLKGGAVSNGPFLAELEAAFGQKLVQTGIVS